MREKIGKLIISLGELIAGKRIKDIDLKSVEEILIKEEYKKNFNVRAIREKTREWIIELEEKKELIPEALNGKDVVLNGYMDQVEIVDHPLRGKLVYLQFFRRRWKEQGKKESYSNEYELHPPGMKATPEFGAFLKELDRQERDEFFCTFPNIRHISQKDF